MDWLGQVLIYFPTEILRDSVVHLHRYILDAPLPLGPVFFIFTHFSEKFSWIIAWRPHFEVGAPVGNPGYTTDIYQLKYRRDLPAVHDEDEEELENPKHDSLVDHQELTPCLIY